MTRKIKIVLSMIVKDEAKIIVETLDHLRIYFDISVWIICDTGSSDQTVKLVNDYLATHGLIGKVFEHEWKDFAHNRNLALECSRNRAEYILFWDADDRVDGELILPCLDKEAYAFKLKEDNGVIHYRYLLVRNDLNCIWRSRLHEFIDFSSACETSMVGGDYHVKVGHFGARSQNKNKYYIDAKNLTLFYAEESNLFLKARYAYYCAVSYFNVAQYKQAKIWFELRLQYSQEEMGLVLNRDEEYNCYLNLGHIALHFKDESTAVSILSIAIQQFPQRFDAFYALSRLYLDRKNDQMAYDYALHAKKNIREHLNIMVPHHTFSLDYGIDLTLLYSSLRLGKHDIAYHFLLSLLTKKPLSNQFYLSLLTVISELYEQCLAEKETVNKKLLLHFLQLPQFKNSQIIKMREKVLRQLKSIKILL